MLGMWKTPVVLFAALAASAPAMAQITSQVDEAGRRVFVNEGAGGTLPRTTAAPAATPASARLQQASFRRTSGATRVSYTRDQLQELARMIAERYQVDPDLIHALIAQESAWDPEAISYKGALGLMQLMPGTAGDLGVSDPFDPQQNLDGGIRHLRMLLEKYGGDLDRALAAYNAGGGAVDRAGGVPNYPETRNYVQKITDNYFQPGASRQPIIWRTVRKVYQSVDARGRRIYTNE
jgi:soluble lytic murein transglycosylase-like protein